MSEVRTFSPTMTKIPALPVNYTRLINHVVRLDKQEMIAWLTTEIRGEKGTYIDIHIGNLPMVVIPLIGPHLTGKAKSRLMEALKVITLSWKTFPHEWKEEPVKKLLTLVSHFLVLDARSILKKWYLSGKMPTQYHHRVLKCLSHLSSSPDRSFWEQVRLLNNNFSTMAEDVLERLHTAPLCS